ncbi:hypothetical protein F0224_02580 [Vibrio coralliilyticus]|jgi:hypothetical protein|uniref:hypothetical protein n=1 Tax=Vibrio coralliilyticus TaxID=190893 RepID=UPI0002DE6610|nr:hypothetical protein [Vibrio coralliilyticus]AXN34150.1 hypothetical protein DVV14_23250 [Vibrio coralliilyticus]ERB63554.1 hypothetical protein N779_20240 [Vibrio coralliilyticus OCN008]KPH24313.1 hypothetical protein ADU60_23250 [Vibrio coralliilyticus]NOH56100.1 hypothetical protein [Vibrio coralliilyticus]NOI74549.1 hypothetical protein [Vibrio coralliilyticus]
MKFIRSSVLLISLFISGTVFAADYGVELSWNTDNAEQVLKTLPEQKAAFGELIEQGAVKDMFVIRSKVDGKPIQLLRFVLEADSEADVQRKLKDLPMYKKELVKISNIRMLGSKWLDNTPVYNNYGVVITWKEGIEALEMDRVLGIDLQRVISLNQAGFITSSYLDTQKLSNGVVRPIYSVSFLAKDAQHARELSNQFEAVTLGYATIEIQHLGHKISLSR